jgi:hypothetical protein
MCIVVYLASDYPLPTSAWDPARRCFHVVEVAERDHEVRRQFSKPHVYYTGSHEGCGCGFQYGEYEEEEEDAAKLAAAQDSRRRLVEFLSVALQHQTTVELFACWNGDEAAPPEHRGCVGPAELLRDRTFFREKELLVISEAGAAGVPAGQ